MAITTILVLGIIAYGYIRGRWDWDGTGFSGASLWNWLDLLIVPLVLGIGGIWFQRAQRQRELQVQDEQTQRELKLQRQHAQDTALQAYVDQMSELLIDKKLHDETDPYSDKRVTARARTLAVLSQLTGERPRWVLQFLYEMRLISRGEELGWGEELKKRVIQPRIVGLDGATLRGANLRYITLNNAALNGAILESANLRDTRLSGIDLGGAYLSGADLRGADLSEASLREAHLQRKDELKLEGANLRGADLSGADLSGAKVSDEQLAACLSLQGATMPDGSKHD